MKKKRIGIIGGMGPLAGVELQRLLVTFTPARRDQDHQRVVCLTEPQIPDRTTSILKNHGHSYTRALTKILREMETLGVTVAAIPCNTAHARLAALKAATSVPIVNMVALACRAAAAREGPIGLLATDGTLATGVYEANAAAEGFAFCWVRPRWKERRKLMKVIYRIKAGRLDVLPEIKAIVAALRTRGARTIILGCTELSLYYEVLADENLIDPLRLLAKALAGPSGEPSSMTQILLSGKARAASRRRSIFREPARRARQGNKTRDEGWGTAL